MNLDRKKRLASRTLGVGAGRIKFESDFLDEIKAAITKQDIKDLVARGAIKIKNKEGRKKIEAGKRRRGFGRIKKKIKQRKKRYVVMARKLRGYISELKKQDKIKPEKYHELRKMIKGNYFKSKGQIKGYLK
jgi:large subunit ribosomal protein L19e